MVLMTDLLSETATSKSKIINFSADSAGYKKFSNIVALHSLGKQTIYVADLHISVYDLAGTFEITVVKK